MTIPDDETPGWDAINAALASIYGEQEPQHFGPLLHYRLGGSDPLDGISAYARELPVPHWHLVSFGMSELYAKEWEDPDWSGWGFEFTLRLARAENEKAPPAWALNFLNNLARYVFNSGNMFAEGHYMDLNGPIALGQDTEICAIVFAQDPELAPLRTTNGRLSFLQIIGITLDELEAIKAWDGNSIMKLLGKSLPLLVTDLDRASLLQTDPGLARQLADGAAAEGSTCTALHIGNASFQRSGNGLCLIFGANGIRDLRAVLPGRIPFGRNLDIYSRSHRIEFMPADALAWETIADDHVRVHLTAAMVPQLLSVLKPVTGRVLLPQWPDVEIVIEKSVIRDAEGNVVREIG